MTNRVGLLNLVCVAGLMLFINMQAMAEHAIEFFERELYGPGPFPDQKLRPAWLRDLEMKEFLIGEVKGSNNLGDEPNVSGEALQGKTIDGMLSDKTLINESIDMANAVIMNGQFNLLLAAVFGGPNEGDTFFYHDEDFNWWIKDDIAIDPGFPAGVIKIDNFTFTTAPRIIPASMQAEHGYPGGTNQIGSLSSGRIAMGRLGDSNEDGYLDGTFNAIGRFPMDSIFLPGAPFVQLFEFKSDIPISSLDAALLTMASARSYTKKIAEVKKSDAGHPDIAVMQEKIAQLVSQSIAHLKKASGKADCVNCKKLKKISEPLEGGIKTGAEQEAVKLVDDAFNKILQIRGNI